MLASCVLFAVHLSATIIQELIAKLIHYVQLRTAETYDGRACDETTVVSMQAVWGLRTVSNVEQ